MMSSPDPGTRYAILTTTDQAANVWVTSILSIAFSTVCLGVRIVCKRRFESKFGADDYVFGTAWGIHVIQAGLIMKALVLGFGKDDTIIAPANVPAIKAYTTASIVFAILSLYAVKISMILLIQKLFNRKLLVVWIVIVALGVVAIVELQAGCEYPTCTTGLPRAIVAVAFDILTELFIIALPIYCIRNIRMKKMRKAKVLFSFSSRLIVATFSATALWAITHVAHTGVYSTSVVLPFILLQLELCFSLCIAAIIPCFRLIFQSSEKVNTNTTIYEREKRKEESDSVGERPYSLQNVQDDVESKPPSRIGTPTPPGRAIHSKHSSEDMSNAGSHTTGRVSESSLVPSANTGLSSKPLIQVRDV